MPGSSHSSAACFTPSEHEGPLQALFAVAPAAFRLGDFVASEEEWLDVQYGRSVPEVQPEDVKKGALPLHQFDEGETDWIGTPG